MRWLFRVETWRNNTRYERIIPYHVCTDEDFDKFYPIRADEAPRLKRIRDDPDRGFLCFDWENDDPLSLFGQYEHSQDYQEVEATLAPCNYLHN